ncbi:hypothetical protein HPB50_018004 [Hyalomma asiaticum]|uniref:Uncharacterized protein n=1 Tax=Hyalomma asiaticum TaxID=266040 RepID=A0ACB7SKV2_HYAAI|nr:hypothetical protein HPB50_018004 [Hyalomma asiaticum]
MARSSLRYQPLFSYEDVTDSDAGPSSRADSSTDSHGGAPSTVRNRRRELGDSMEEISVEDDEIENDEAPPEESSSQREGSSDSSDSWSVVILPGRARHATSHLVRNWPKYAFATILVIAVASVYPLSLFFRSLSNTRSDAALPTHLKKAASMVPWRDRKRDDGFPRILIWNETAFSEWWKRGMPQLRSDDQFWVFWATSGLLPEGYFAHESHSLPFNASIFNWTMAYMDDADIALSYDTWRCHFDGAAKEHSDTINPAKRKDVAWMVGDCELHRFSKFAHSHLEKQALKGNSLAGTGSVRIIPACGKHHCSSPHECVADVAKNYNFLIVSLDPDCFQSPYELIYEAFQYTVVPVVLAPPNTTLNIPAHSVVLSSELRGPGDLAARLRDIRNDRALYESYFAWKRKCSWKPSESELCPLCRALWKTPAHYRHTHPDVRGWWARNSMCKKESVLHGLHMGFTKKT